MKGFDIRETQLQQLDMLKTLVELFDKEGLKYFAIGGTALGAIRHKGFIPWDDDIDIAMLRDDYERFLTLGDKLPENLFILSHTTNKNYPVQFSKVMNNDLPFPFYSMKKYDYPRKVFIDIFPWGNIVDSAELRKNLSETNRRFRRSIYKHNGNFFDKLKFYIYKLVYGFKDSSYFYDKYKTLSSLKDGEKSTTWGYVCFNDVLEYDDIFPLRAVDFEDTKIFVPNSCEKYLTQKYGDYMKIPDEKDRVNHSTLKK